MFRVVRFGTGGDPHATRWQIIYPMNPYQSPTLTAPPQPLQIELGSEFRFVIVVAAWGWFLVFLFSPKPLDPQFYFHWFVTSAIVVVSSYWSLCTIAAPIVSAWHEADRKSICYTALRILPLLRLLLLLLLFRSSVGVVIVLLAKDPFIPGI